MVKKISLGIFALIGLVLTFGSEGAYDTTFSFGDDQKPSLTLSHNAWDDGIATSAVVATVLRGEGFTVTPVQLDPAILFNSIATSSSDFTVSPWRLSHGNYIEEYEDQIDIVRAHAVGAENGLTVPAYMEDINSIGDLTDEANQTITSIEPGATIIDQANDMLDIYPNLSEWDLQVSSTGAMLTALRQAMANEEEIVITAWKPHWMFSEFDLKILEDPNEAYGKGEELLTIARLGLKEENPRAYEILENFSWEVEDMQQVMLYLQDDMSPTAAARKWLDENPEKVAEWVQTSEQ